jgi:iron complex transport system ATP-binding protein
MIVAHRVELHAGSRLLVEPASFIVERGHFVAVLGANGAGKTTLLRTLAGVRPYTSGSIHIAQRDLKNLSTVERASLIAHLTGDDVFVDKLTVRDVVATGRYSHHRWWQWRRTRSDDEAVEAALRDVQMATFADRTFDTLSSGERQRVWIALALAQEAPILLLDEPTSHLDIRAAQEILTLLRRLCNGGKTIVCALHDLNEAAQVADRVLLLGEQRLLAFDTPERVFSGSAVERAYRVPLRTVRDGDGMLRIFPVHHS